MSWLTESNRLKHFLYAIPKKKKGIMLLGINGKELILNPGDSLYFDSSIPHGMMALDDKTVKFLAVIF